MEMKIIRDYFEIFLGYRSQHSCYSSAEFHDLLLCLQSGKKKIDLVKTVFLYLYLLGKFVERDLSQSRTKLQIRKLCFVNLCLFFMDKSKMWVRSYRVGLLEGNDK